MESAPGARPCLLQLSTRESSFHNTSLMKLLLLNKAVITTRIQNFAFQMLQELLHTRFHFFKTYMYFALLNFVHFIGYYKQFGFVFKLSYDNWVHLAPVQYSPKRNSSLLLYFVRRYTLAIKLHLLLLSWGVFHC